MKNKPVELAIGEQVRHGDVLIQRVDVVPDGKPIRRESGRIVLAKGEKTGHAHTIAAPAIKWIEAGQQRYLDASTAFTVAHEEHAAITLAPGAYRVWQQREYHPSEIRTVRD